MDSTHDMQTASMEILGLQAINHLVDGYHACKTDSRKWWVPGVSRATLTAVGLQLSKLQRLVRLCIWCTTRR